MRFGSIFRSSPSRHGKAIGFSSALCLHDLNQQFLDRQWLEDDLGAIDGTHIQAIPHRGDRFKERFRNRKQVYSQNVMAVVDFDGNFVAVVAGWEGSAHDNMILRRAVNNGFTVPQGRYYLVDGGYINTPQFLAPYRCITYHLAQFRARGRGENSLQHMTDEGLFNVLDEDDTGVDDDSQNGDVGGSDTQNGVNLRDCIRDVMWQML
ncbi:hypothetical protein LUZ61_012566 [Rhynchospora tenuis]|uniref:DDE Tnp4 domain-containing protein n=1 Tax=Rhynchospora tenuis TaxID=198213 RepID=A0AAD6A3B9_9POAL|nr:hypothetical protein LUZ61_012566 [Rhynchospora tenuis]